MVIELEPRTDLEANRPNHHRVGSIADQALLEQTSESEYTDESGESELDEHEDYERYNHRTADILSEELSISQLQKQPESGIEEVKRPQESLIDQEPKIRSELPLIKDETPLMNLTLDKERH